mgnify:CR=1 FL=1
MAKEDAIIILRVSFIYQQAFIRSSLLRIPVRGIRVGKIQMDPAPSFVVLFLIHQYYRKAFAKDSVKRFLLFHPYKTFYLHVRTNQLLLYNNV